MIVTRSSRDYPDRTVRTLDGKPVPVEEAARQLPSAELSVPSFPPTIFSRPDWRARIKSVNDGAYPPVYWYFVHDGRPQGSAYLIGFDSRSKLRVGYLGTLGFRRDEPPPAERFQIPANRIDAQFKLASPYHYSRADEPDYIFPGDWPSQRWPHYIVHIISGNRLLEVDLRRRSVRTLTGSPDLVSLGVSQQAVPRGASEEERAKDRRFLAVRTSDRVRLIDPPTGQERSYPLPRRVRRKNFSFYELADGTAIIETRRYLNDPKSPIDLDWIDSSGKVVRTAEVTLRWTAPESDPRIGTAGASLLVPVPTIWAIVVGIVVPVRYLDTGRSPTYAAALARVLTEGWPAVVISTLLAVASAWYCARRQREFAAGQTCVWVAFVFLFGPPALVGYLFHRRWPPLLPCPTCHAVSPRDRDACVVCANPFPAPEAKGIEVFA